MAFALTKFVASGILFDGACDRHGIQRVEMTITGLNTDVTYDLGTTAGTFWTSAIANATYGSLATGARDFLLNKLSGVVGSVLEIRSQQLAARLQAAAASGTSYVQSVASVTTPVPQLTFAASNAPTSGIYVIEWTLQDGQLPLTATFG